MMRRPRNIRQVQQFVRFCRIQRERFLDIDVAAGLQTQTSQWKMGLGWCGDVDRVHSTGTEHLRRIGKDLGDTEAISELRWPLTRPYRRQRPVRSLADNAVDPRAGPQSCRSR